MGRKYEYINISTPKIRAKPGLSHDLQLLRDLEIANARTVAELGPLPPGGLPVVPKGKYIPPQLAARPEHGQENFENQEDETMKWSQVVAMVAGMAATQAGCAPASQEKPVIEYKQNPTPAKAYELRMRIDNAPGAFGLIQGFMQFDVTNTACLPPPKDNPAGYSSPVPTRSIPFGLQRQADGEYVGTVFTDGMINEDYHGYGICKWELINVQVRLKASGIESETLFMADLYGRELQGGKTKTLHYWKGGYPRSPGSKIDNFPASGQSDRTKMAPDLTDDDVFIITMASKELTP